MKHLSNLFRWISHLLLAAVTVAIFSAFLIQTRNFLPERVITLLYLVPVIVSSTIWGVYAGIAASILSFLFYNYYFIAPYYTLRVSHPQDFLAMVILLGVAILISSLMARIQANLRQARDREREARELSQLSLDLTSQQSTQSICEVLALHLAKFFQGATVVVEINRENHRVRIKAPEVSEEPTLPATRHIILSSPHGLVGDIWIWLARDALEPEEERLLQTFANQGALAFDRAELVDVQTRARVLEESDKLKTAILSSVSHELRTPLASIQAVATSLFNPEVELESAASSELQSLLLEEINHMIQLVSNLLNMSRIEAGAMKLQRQWNSFAEIVDLGIRSLRRGADDRKIEVDVSDELPLVSIDAVLMEQVIINLVRNSLRFSPSNSVIRLIAKVDEQALWVTVTNDGPHIPQEHINHIFEKFYPNPSRDGVQGTGLGLSICKGVIEAHGGRIWAENLPVGVAFRFTIPLTWEGSHPIVPDQEREEE